MCSTRSALRVGVGDFVNDASTFSSSAFMCSAKAKARVGIPSSTRRRFTMFRSPQASCEAPARLGTLVLPLLFLEVHGLTLLGAFLPFPGIVRGDLGRVGPDAGIRMRQVALEHLPRLPPDEPIPIEEPVDVSRSL